LTAFSRKTARMRGVCYDVFVFCRRLVKNGIEFVGFNKTFISSSIVIFAGYKRTRRAMPRKMIPMLLRRSETQHLSMYFPCRTVPIREAKPISILHPNRNGRYIRECTP
jgi:hypothetical protein